MNLSDSSFAILIVLPSNGKQYSRVLSKPTYQLKFKPHRSTACDPPPEENPESGGRFRHERLVGDAPVSDRSPQSSLRRWSLPQLYR